MRSLTATAVLFAALGAVAPSALRAQSGKDVVNGMLAEYERRIANVTNYTLVQEVTGMPVTMYFEKITVDGRPVFALRQVTVGQQTISNAEDKAAEHDLYGELPKIADRATVTGRETVDGRAVHVIAVENMEDLRLGQGGMPDNVQFTPRRATLFVDTKLSVPRRVILEGQMRTQDQTSDVTATTDLLDYRETQGMLHPFHTRTQIDGMGQSVDPETRKQYEQMKKQLADMPESQRAMVEQMMKGRMEQMEQMMSGGPMTIDVLVKELRVNRGPPKR